jgi:drug/metabolite transporter (DMT)-like permease
MERLRAAQGRLFAQPYLLLTLVTLMWGGNAVASRIAIGEVSPMALVALRWVIVLILLAVFARTPLRLEWRSLRPYWGRIFVLGSLGFTVFNALFYVAGHYTTAVNLGLIQGIIPGLAMLGSLLAYGTPIRPLQILGLTVALAGVGIVASRGDLAVLSSLAFNFGDLCMMAASALYAAYTVALRNRPPVAGLTFFAALAVAAFLSSLPLLGYEIAAGTVQWPTPKGWGVLIYVGLMPSLISQIMWMRGVELIGPGRTALFINLVPVFAAFLGVVILGETFALYHAVALSLVLGGIWIAERGKR